MGEITLQAIIDRHPESQKNALGGQDMAEIRWMIAEIQHLQAEVERLELKAQLNHDWLQSCKRSCSRHRKRADNLQTKLDAVAELPGEWCDDVTYDSKSGEPLDAFKRGKRECANELQSIISDEEQT